MRRTTRATLPPLVLRALCTVLLVAPGVARPAPAAHLSGATTPPPPLVVLRAACHAPDVWREAAAAERSPMRLLPYNETCSRGWEARVSAGVLGALGAGGAVLAAGWPGTAACLALRAAATGGGAGGGDACGAPGARGAALSWLAARLAWRRALLPADGAAPCAECRDALDEAARALALSGVRVRRELAPDEYFENYVVIVCGCGAWSAAALRAARLAPTVDAMRALLLLRVAPDWGNEGEHTAIDNDTQQLTFSEDTIWGEEVGSWGALPPLLLGDSPLGVAPPAGRDLLRGVVAEAGGEREGGRSHRFHLYEGAAGAWSRVAELAAWGAGRDVNVTGDVTSAEEWCRTRASLAASAPEPGWVARARGALLALCCALCAALALSAASRALAGVLRARRRRAAVLLAAGELTWPDGPGPDAGVGGMLSCFLHQLHEFGGPELERPDLLKRPPTAPRVRYKGEAVHVRALPRACPELRRSAADILLTMRSLRHENINSLIGVVVSPGMTLVSPWCPRGSLEDVLRADALPLDWTFRLSLLTDALRGLRALHASPLRAHGRLSSRNCVVDARWVLRLADYGLPALALAQGARLPPRAAKELLWTAPELLRADPAGVRGGTPAGDVFSFAIIMQEVIVRGEPYCMLALRPDEILEKLRSPPPLIRPSVPLSAAPPDAVRLLRCCWAESPLQRPSAAALLDRFRHLHHGRKANIVDSMFEMMEKHSDNLERLVRERTRQLELEKRKTERLLNRMLPPSAAARLLAGGRVEPEEFSAVTIYFSDIVGFTRLAARCEPREVVALLNALYSAFDAVVARHSVYKVETIGDAYMVVGGLPERCADHAGRVARVALRLLRLAGAVREPRRARPRAVRLRVGLHSGRCAAGVVGLTMPRYCLFGDTVNTASRMESTGAPGRIQVSAATAALLQADGGFRLRSRGLTRVKGKGAMHTYWLLGEVGEGDERSPAGSDGRGTTDDDDENADEGDDEEDEDETEDEVPAPSASPRPDPFADIYAYQQAGTASADSSPARYRRQVGAEEGKGAGEGRGRRQWSLDGEAVASSPPASPPPAACSLSALCGPLPAPRAPRPPRYRTRADSSAHGDALLAP